MQTFGLANATGPDPVRLLEELKRIAVEQLGAIPGGLYRPIEEQLQSTQLTQSDAHRKDLISLLGMRQRSASLLMRYREMIARNFDDFVGRPRLAGSGLVLGLVDEEQLGFHLAGQRLVESIGHRHQGPLEILDLRFEALATALGAATTTNPVGAMRLAGAFLHTFSDVELSETLQPLLVRQYELELSRVLGDLYGKLNSKLAEAGFNAGRRPELVQRHAPVAPPSAEVQTPAPPRERVATAPTNPGIDLFRISAEARVQHQRLRDMLHAWRSSSALQVVPADGQRRELCAKELSTVAALLQRDTVRPFELALSGHGSLHAAIRSQLLDGARSLGLDPEQTRLAEPTVSRHISFSC